MALARVLSVLLFCGAMACASPPGREGLVIANVTVVSPERTAPLEHAYVWIVGGRVAEVSEQRLRGANEIDGTGRYLVPGLVDSHVHLVVPPGFPPPMTAEQAAANPEIVAAVLAQDPRSYLFYGFTTVLDLVGTAERTAQWNALPLRPDAHFCSAAAFVDGSWRFVRYPFFSYPASADERMPPAPNPADHTPQAMIARMAAEGAICVKTVYDDHARITPDAQDLRALVTAAHEHALPVFIHANRRQAQAAAVAAEVDVIAHGMWRDEGEAPELDDEGRAILAAVARLRVGYQPTTQVMVGLFHMLDEDYLARPDLGDVYPAAVTGWYASEQVRNNHWTGSVSANFEARLLGSIARAREVTGVLAEANARLIFGSDTASDMIYTNPPGLNGRLEMNNWIAAGVTEAQLFRALTLENARMLGLDGEIGAVAPGMRANLLLLSANPLETVTAYDAIEIVFLHGRPIARASLSARNAPR